MPQLPSLEEHSAFLPDGRRIVLWSLTPEQVIHPLPIVIGSGFAHRMDHFASLALYLVQAGFCVVRYDSVDHVGLSDGEMEDYTLSAGLASLERAVEWTCAHRNVNSVGLLATSLTARVAYEVIARNKNVSFLVTIVGVVDVHSTLECVFGCDYMSMPAEELPEFVYFQRRRIRSRVFYRDCHDQHWGKANESARVLAMAPQPVIAFLGERDPWVDAPTVRAILEQRHAPGRVIEVPGSGHFVSVNPAIARVLMGRITGAVLELAGASSDRPWCEPVFSELTEQTLLERRLQRSRNGSAALQATIGGAR